MKTDAEITTDLQKIDANIDKFESQTFNNPKVINPVQKVEKTTFKDGSWIIVTKSCSGGLD